MRYVRPLGRTSSKRSLGRARAGKEAPQSEPAPLGAGAQLSRCGGFYLFRPGGDGTGNGAGSVNGNPPPAYPPSSIWLFLVTGSGTPLRRRSLSENGRLPRSCVCPSRPRCVGVPGRACPEVALSPAWSNCARARYLCAPARLPSAPPGERNSKQGPVPNYGHRPL